MKYIVTINGKNYEVEVEQGQASIVKTTQAAIAPVQATAQAAATSQGKQQVNISGEPIKSPMPGTILAVKVNPGASVKKGDVIFILEAMKMENEITSPKDGVVSEILVAKGASVSTGDILAALQ